MKMNKSTQDGVWYNFITIRMTITTTAKVGIPNYSSYSYRKSQKFKLYYTTQRIFVWGFFK